MPKPRAAKNVSRRAFIPGAFAKKSHTSLSEKGAWVEWVRRERYENYRKGREQENGHTAAPFPENQTMTNVDL